MILAVLISVKYSIDHNLNCLMEQLSRALASIHFVCPCSILSSFKQKETILTEIVGFVVLMACRRAVMHE